MGIFGNKYTYKITERLTPSEARERRLVSLLQKERQALEVRVAPLSPANKFHLNKLKEFENKFGAELEARRKRALELQSLERSEYEAARNKRAISRLFQLQQRRAALLQNAAAERRANSVKKSFVDRRFYDPTRDDRSPRPKTVFGTTSWLKVSLGPVARRQHRNPTISLPCIDRLVRREVMFAHRHAGHGHRGKRKFNPLSLIGC